MKRNMTGWRGAGAAGVAALALLAVAVLTLSSVREQREEVVCSRARCRSFRVCTEALSTLRRIRCTRATTSTQVADDSFFTCSLYSL